MKYWDAPSESEKINTYGSALLTLLDHIKMFLNYHSFFQKVHGVKKGPIHNNKISLRQDGISLLIFYSCIYYKAFS